MPAFAVLISPSSFFLLFPLCSVTKPLETKTETNTAVSAEEQTRLGAEHVDELLVEEEQRVVGKPRQDAPRDL